MKRLETIRGGFSIRVSKGRKEMSRREEKKTDGSRAEFKKNIGLAHPYSWLTERAINDPCLHDQRRGGVEVQYMLGGRERERRGIAWERGRKKNKGLKKGGTWEYLACEGSYPLMEVVLL